MTDQPNTERRLPTADEVRGILKPDPPEQERCREAKRCTCGRNVEAGWHKPPCPYATPAPPPQEGDEGEAVASWTVYVCRDCGRVHGERRGFRNPKPDRCLCHSVRLDPTEVVPRSAYDRAIEERDEARSGIKGRNAIIDKLTAERDRAIERAEAAERERDEAIKEREEVWVLNQDLASDAELLDAKRTVEKYVRLFEQARSSLTTLQGRVREVRDWARAEAKNSKAESGYWAKGGDHDTASLCDGKRDAYTDLDKRLTQALEEEGS